MDSALPVGQAGSVFAQVLVRRQMQTTRVVLECLFVCKSLRNALAVVLRAWESVECAESHIAAVVVEDLSEPAPESETELELEIGLEAEAESESEA